MKILKPILGALLFWVGLYAAEYRTWTNQDGRKLEAKAVAFEGDLVNLQLRSGKRYQVALNSLSQSDQDFVAELKEAQKEVLPYEKLNAVFGHDAFSEESTLWQRPAAELAELLKVPVESKTDFSSSFRRYFISSREGEYREREMFGAKANTMAIYGNAEGLATRISIVYANLGDIDLSSTSYLSRGRFLEKAMEADADALESILTPILGEGVRQRFGEGALRRTVTRWDAGDHAFVLSLTKAKYVGLEIIPKEVADAEGETERVTDSQLKKQLEKNIVEAENGDVYLKNLPMIDQGPKGYCVPATAESALRYMGVDADMYIIANNANTGIGGGTRISDLMVLMKKLAGRKGRSCRDINLTSLRLSSVTRFLDQGYPILWTMRSTKRYNEFANNRTIKRRNLEWSEYVDTIEDDVKKNLKYTDEDSPDYHICMIIGYNEDTEELAVRDSWGPQYAMRWVHVDEAAPFSDGGLIISK